jgi:chromosome segregation ATPase
MAELEGQLAEALDSLARQQQETEENATSFGQVMARLSHSERTLGQTKSKLMDAEARIEKSEARVASLSEQLSQVEALASEQRATSEREAQGQREAEEQRERALRQEREKSAAELKVHEVEIARLRRALETAQARELELTQSLETLNAQNEAKTRELEDAHESTSRALAQEKALRDLAESLSRDSAAGAAECARLSEHWKAAQEREQHALSRALAAETALVEQRAELEQARDTALAGLVRAQATLAEREAERARDQRELASADQERARFIGILGAIEVLGREIAEVGFQARTAAETRSKLKAEEMDADRTTLRPEPPPKPAPRSLRSSTAPEITVDGVRLDP